ncbi:MAG: amidase [Aureispira sp.]
MKNTIHAYKNDLLGTLDATALAEHLRQKDFTAQELASCAINRAQTINPRLNAIAYADFERALQQAIQVEQGIWAGIPIFIKDLIHVEGMPTRQGSAGIGDKLHKKNEKITQQLLSLGVLPLGKSITSEFGLMPTSETLLHGITQNPMAVGYSTGGSSGGAGALVASGIVPVAHAADGGGSIRIPASCCGLVGFKPSRGRDVDSPTKPLPIDIVVQGVLTRSVRDAIAYQIGVEAYHQAANLPKIGAIDRPLERRLKIGYFSQTPTKMNSHADMQAAVKKAGLFCEGLGHTVEEIACPFTQETKIDFLGYWSLLSYLIVRFGKFSYGLDFKARKVEPFTREMAKTFPKVMFNSRTIVRRLKRFAAEYDALHQEYDILLSPVLSHPTPPIGYFDPTINFFSSIEKLSQYVNFTIFQNVSGAPAISLPMAESAQGLPIGVQFSGKVGADRLVLELALEVEQKGGFINWQKRLITPTT